MFNFFYDIGNYEQRKIARYDGDGLMIDTARCSDGKQPYETAVESPLYNNGKMIIVEAYDTPEQAQQGHDRWVAIMTTKPPDKLVDCLNAEITAFGESLFGEDWQTEFPSDD